MADISHVAKSGNLLIVRFSDDTETLCYPTQGDYWVGNSGAVVDPDPVDPPPTGTGEWTHPLPGAAVTGEYGESRGGYTHVGLDLSTVGGTGPGSNVLAPADMIITVSREHLTGGLPDAGSYVKGHTTSGEAFSFSFFHMVKGSLTVSVGQRITAGTKIGVEGNTGNSSGTHLHLEIWPGHMEGDFFYWGDGTPPNPEPILNAKGVFIR